MTKLPVDTKDFQKCLCELLLLESLSFSESFTEVVSQTRVMSFYVQR